MTTDNSRADALTDRDYDLHEHEQGLYRKFDVRRVDGSSEPGGKHHDCEYFVLDMMHDQHARAALRAYADACASTHPELSADLIARYGLSHVEQPAEAPIDEPVAAWINYPVKTVDGEFAGYEKPELSFTRPAYGYDITMAEPLYRRAGAPAVAPIDRVRVEVYDILANFGQMPPEEDETWESWYAAAFDMAAEQIMNAFESAMPAHWYDDEAIRFFVEHQRHRQALRAKPKANPAPSPADERAAQVSDYLNAPGMWAQVYCCAVFVKGWPSDMARSAADEAVKEFGDAACKTVADLTHTLDEVLRMD
ncbi:hypothetical protein [Burkholderia pseudomallei]|uniref:hypothetical protein n=1 Tax=Burkholderia pseudomallei TaxID=28450 RepID=UPI000A1A0435|nr:hypothetical protein [Burkholderia pseudomallei]ARL57151.1 hypothetical protein BOC52_11735 [Burkholderia pseudomallei]ARL64182.1 hypothetical protein BOC53_12425 [Burkholderia pseudomallei]